MADRLAAAAAAERITVYPARFAGDRWRAMWYEPDGRRKQCEAVGEERLAARLEPVIERLAAEAPKLLRPGSALIAHYLSPDRLPPERQWSRKHADTQRDLCARYLQPVIGHLSCQDIKTAHMQAVVNAAPTAGEGRRLRGLLSALVNAGIADGYLTSPRLRRVHWQACGRPAGPVRGRVAGETVLYVDPGEIPGSADVARLVRRPAFRATRRAGTSGVGWSRVVAEQAGMVGRFEPGLLLAR